MNTPLRPTKLQSLISPSLTATSWELDKSISLPANKAVSKERVI